MPYRFAPLISLRASLLALAICSSCSTETSHVPPHKDGVNKAPQVGASCTPTAATPAAAGAAPICGSSAQAEPANAQAVPAQVGANVPSGSVGTARSDQAPTLRSQGTAASTLDSNAPGNSPFKITDYGAELAKNKSNLAAVADAEGATAQERALIVAMAMQESTLMATNQRDANKDGTPSANCSFLNVNYDLLKQIGYQGNDNGMSLNRPENLKIVVGFLIKALRTWGITRTLNFQRGGRTAFDDGKSYGAAEFRNAITTIYKQIAADPKLETDGRRVEIDVRGV